MNTVGVATIAVAWGYQGRETLEKSQADMLLAEPMQIIAAVDSIFGVR